MSLHVFLEVPNPAHGYRLPDWPGLLPERVGFTTPPP